MALEAAFDGRAVSSPAQAVVDIERRGNDVGRPAHPIGVGRSGGAPGGSPRATWCFYVASAQGLTWGTVLLRW
jgi:hypothetical protein